MNFRSILITFVAAILAACGGGGGYQGDPPPFTTAKQVSEAYWEAPVIFNRSVYDSIVGSDETGYRVTVTEGGVVLYDKTLPDFGYQAGALTDGTRIRLLSEWASYDDLLPSKDVLFVGDQMFPITFQVKHKASSRLLVMDVSEGAGDWLIIYGAEIYAGEEESEYQDPRSYWSVVNRYTGELVEFGYYDEPPPDLSAMGAKRSLGLTNVSARRLSARAAQTANR